MQDASHDSNGKPHNRAGFISGDAIYSLSEFARRFGLGERALRTAQRRGLPVHRLGRQKMVVGSEVIAWLKSRP